MSPRDTMTARRAALRRLGRLGSLAVGGLSVGAVGGLFSGCGFTMRGAIQMPFRSVSLVGFAPRSSLERAMRTQLSQVARVEANPARAEVILQALNDSRERAVVASTAAGQVREFQLRVKLLWRASTPQGRVLIDASELLLTRDMSTTESAALAKEREAELLYAAMDDDITQQVMRRLATIRMTTSPVSGG